MTIQCLDHAEGPNWSLYHGDCVELMRQMPKNSVDLSVFSPPFSSLYIYSDSERDMGNVGGDEDFQESYYHACKALWDVTKPGRNCAIHVKDLVQYSNASEIGARGIRDFSGDCIRTHQAAGWIYHSRIVIWRDPVKEMQKTKNDRLLYKNFRTDAARSGIGLPEYILVFRKWSDGMDETPNVTHDPNVYDLPTWQQWASPVWMDTRETNVLNVKSAKDEQAERHLCPMPLDLTNRCIQMWSNPGDVVLSPFAGIGSEGFEALKLGRKFIGCELKDSYFQTAAKNLRDAETEADAPLLELLG